MKDASRAALSGVVGVLSNRRTAARRDVDSTRRRAFFFATPPASGFLPRSSFLKALSKNPIDSADVERVDGAAARTASGDGRATKPCT